ncbi:MAG: protease HtpX [Gammaproteobacteria bacterium]|nr:protease HtpX [Gammaproteobacteria bacterium]
MKRVALFVLTNIAILTVASLTFSLLGITDALVSNGFDPAGMLLFCALFGFGGAFVSLALSKWMAKRATGAEVIDAPRNAGERWLLDTVARQSAAAGIAMPDVAVFPSPQPNAFATGASRNKALVAVSTGLLDSMRENEVEAVLGHEIGHVANGDMLTLTLIQGVLNTFVLFLARVIGFAVDRVVLRNEGGIGIGYFVTTIIAQIVLGILASIVVMWFSRQREFRADAQGAQLAGRNNMIAALERLKASSDMPDTMPESMAAFGISSGVRQGLRALFASHPPLDARIAALRAS